VKLSVSLPDEDVRFLDRYAERRSIESRSAVVQRAVRLLRTSELAADYQAAWEEWFDSEDAVLWDRTTGDGIAGDGIE
jgi:Arc/MetJ-type ribon-helix-helix transcriptional regulator